MKTTAMHFQATGPLAGSIPLENEWSEEAEPRILFTGPNGCGKSTLLRAVATLWEGVEFWLNNRKVLPAKHEAYIWLAKGNGAAVVLSKIEPSCYRMSLWNCLQVWKAWKKCDHQYREIANEIAV